MPDPVAIIATLSGFLIGASGLYLTHRSRTSALREQLYSIQITFLLEALDLLFEVEELTRKFVFDEGTPESLRDNGPALARELKKKANQGIIVLPPGSGLLLSFYADRVEKMIEKWIREGEQGKLFEQRQDFLEINQQYQRLQGTFRKEIGTSELSKEMRDQLPNGVRGS